MNWFVKCVILYGRYRQGTQSSVARDATAYDKANSNSTLSFHVASTNWFSPDKSNSPVSVHCSDHIVNGYQRSASIMSNGQSIVPYLKRPALKAAKMFSSGERNMCIDIE